ncbi:hypothetical protein PR048_005433 [Dryococelus australis]|uniref:Uncharacterized protein n=1 Tax=Dryococelus australis TaxID=614101 RepID=A0ABQ9I8R0_9NEOP|nr:hypothetical protein PR048_005433 [Dryococelus australis]
MVREFTTISQLCRSQVFQTLGQEADLLGRREFRSEKMNQLPQKASDFAHPMVKVNHRICAELFLNRKELCFSRAHCLVRLRRGNTLPKCLLCLSCSKTKPTNHSRPLMKEGVHYRRARWRNGNTLSLHVEVQGSCLAAGDCVREATVAKQLDHQEEPDSIPGRFTPDFRKWKWCRTMPLVNGFVGGLPFPPPFHSGAAPHSPYFTRIGHLLCHTVCNRVMGLIFSRPVVLRQGDARSATMPRTCVTLCWDPLNTYSEGSIQIWRLWRQSLVCFALCRGERRVSELRKFCVDGVSLGTGLRWCVTERGRVSGAAEGLPVLCLSDDELCWWPHTKPYRSRQRWKIWARIGPVKVSRQTPASRYWPDIILQNRAYANTDRRLTDSVGPAMAGCRYDAGPATVGVVTMPGLRLGIATMPAMRRLDVATMPGLQRHDLGRLYKYAFLSCSSCLPDSPCRGEHQRLANAMELGEEFAVLSSSFRNLLSRWLREYSVSCVAQLCQPGQFSHHHLVSKQLRVHSRSSANGLVRPAPQRRPLRIPWWIVSSGVGVVISRQRNSKAVSSGSTLHRQWPGLAPTASCRYARSEVTHLVSPLTHSDALAASPHPHRLSRKTQEL